MTPWHAPGLAAEPIQLTLIALAIVGGLACALVQARRDHVRPANILTALPMAILGAGIVGHALHVALVSHGADILSLRTLRVWAGGYNSIGVYLGAAAGATLWWRLRHAPWRQLADACAPAVLFGAALARLGCLWVGCDFGRPVTPASKLGPTLAYPPASAAWRTLGPSRDDLVWTDALHPFPLYESLPLLALVIMLWARPALFGTRPGQRAAGCALVYFSIRFLAEAFRGGVTPTLAGLTALQCIALAGTAAAAAAWVRAPSPT